MLLIFTDLFCVKYSDKDVKRIFICKLTYTENRFSQNRYDVKFLDYITNFGNDGTYPINV